MGAILNCILVGLSLDFFFHLSLPTLKSGHRFSRLGFCNLNVSLPNTFRAFPGVCFFSVTHLALFFCIRVCLYYFICLFSRLSQATHSVFYYTQLLFHCVPRMLLMETLMEEEITHWVLQSLGQCLTQHLQVLAVQLETKVKKTSLFFSF